MPFPSHI